ncbi:hypothetical protein NAEGRDRAFT_80892 [Naegleria gruberi]|uniref:DUF4116 domain-containing protein n=1 Tax=Naegleria gruberi TaxID=5762 RepID=D2VQP3_NAEGR|nr:uncharacterized protein NAEGRDRAFT_80892 [Naegleria gruberi]EFC40983.1 hypothetical protein NAEGRDRAFT_80892 [Naegleria gruberi]|eukprot:XP_002673727.1 hypothetical protein NAEGRDRAFT_80892 [Naegleria gruberi strain NEG-M]
MHHAEQQVIIELIDFNECNSLQTLLTTKLQLQSKGFVKWFTNREIYHKHIRNWKSSHYNRSHLYIPIEFIENRETVLSIVDKDTSVYREYLSLVPSWKNDKEIVMKACQQGGFALTFASEELRNDRDVALSAVKQNGLMISEIPLELRNDRRIVLEAVKQIGIALSHAPSMQSDEEIVLEATRQMTFAFRFASEVLKKDYQFIKKVVSVNGMVLEYLNEEFKGDIDIVKLAICQNGLSLRYVAHFNDDEELVKLAINSNGLALGYASERMKSNIQIVKQAIKQNSCAIEYASTELLELNPEIQQYSESIANQEKSPNMRLHNDSKVLYRDTQNLKFITGQMKGDIEFALKVLKQNNKVFQEFPQKLQENKEFVIQALKQEHPDQILNLYSQLSETLKSDVDILCESIKINPSVIGQAPDNVFSDREFIHTLVKLNGFSLCYLKPFIKPSDRELALSAIRQNGLALMFCSNRWKFNAEMIIEAVKQNGFIIPYPYREENQVYRILFGENFLKELRQIRMSSCYMDCYIPDRYLDSRVC